MRDATVAERTRLEQELAVAASERRRVDEASTRGETQIKELQKDKASLQARAESAENRLSAVDRLRRCREPDAGVVALRRRCCRRGRRACA